MKKNFPVVEVKAESVFFLSTIEKDLTRQQIRLVNTRRGSNVNKTFIKYRIDVLETLKRCLVSTGQSFTKVVILLHPYTKVVSLG